jgi:hypothetical protein
MPAARETTNAVPHPAQTCKRGTLGASVYLLIRVAAPVRGEEVNPRPPTRVCDLMSDPCWREQGWNPARRASLALLFALYTRDTF